MHVLKRLYSSSEPVRVLCRHCMENPRHMALNVWIQNPLSFKAHFTYQNRKLLEQDQVITVDDKTYNFSYGP